MSTKYRNRRTHSDTAFPTLAVGEIAANTANRQLAVGSAKGGSEGTPLPFIGVRVFSEDASYAQNEFVVHQGCLYRADGGISPGVFNDSSWSGICPGEGAIGQEVIIWTQAAHGFTSADIGTPMYLSGSTWVKADASVGTKLKRAVLRTIVDTSTIQLQQTGYLTEIDASVNGASPLLPGTVYYTSAATPGQVTSTPPTAVGTYIDAVMVGLTSTTALILEERAVENTNAHWVWTNAAGHGFTDADIGRAVSLYGGTWGFPNILDADIDMAIAVIAKVIDANNFYAVYEGIVSDITYTTFTVGVPLYLQANGTTGNLGIFAPAGDGNIMKQMVGFALAADTIYVSVQDPKEQDAWFDMQFSALAMSYDHGGTLAPSVGYARLGDMIIDHLTFGWGEGNDDEAVLYLPCPQDWNGNDFKFKCSWVASATATAGQVARLRVSARIIEDNYNLATPLYFSGGTTLIETLAVGTTHIQVSPHIQVTAQGSAAAHGKVLAMQVKRMCSNVGDTLVGGMLVIAFELQFPRGPRPQQDWDNL